MVAFSVWAEIRLSIWRNARILTLDITRSAWLRRFSHRTLFARFETLNRALAAISCEKWPMHFAWSIGSLFGYLCQ